MFWRKCRRKHKTPPVFTLYITNATASSPEDSNSNNTLPVSTSANEKFVYRLFSVTFFLLTKNRRKENEKYGKLEGRKARRDDEVQKDLLCLVALDEVPGRKTPRGFARVNAGQSEKTRPHEERHIELEVEPKESFRCTAKRPCDRFDGVVVPRILSLRSLVSWSISHPPGPPTRAKGTITPAPQLTWAPVHSHSLQNAPLTFCVH